MQIITTVTKTISTHFHAIRSVSAFQISYFTLVVNSVCAFYVNCAEYHKYITLNINRNISSYKQAQDLLQWFSNRSQRKHVVLHMSLNYSELFVGMSCQMILSTFQQLFLMKFLSYCRYGWHPATHFTMSLLNCCLPV